MTESTEKTYAWRGRGPAGVSAQAAGEIVVHIAERDGRVAPTAIVDEARPTSSPIHDAFEWHDATAAEEHRKWQARHLVRNIRVITLADDGERQSTPVVVHVKKEGANPGGYYTAARILGEPDLFLRAVTEAESKLASARRSVDELKHLADTSAQRDKLAAISIVAKSLATAAQALRVIH